MIIRYFAIVALSILTTNAVAEVITCTFKQPGQFPSQLVYNEELATVTTTVGKDRKVRIYDREVFETSGLEPYGNEGFSIIVSGDVPAIHLKQTNRATLPQDKCKVYPYESYWGNIPGRLEEANFIEGWFIGDFGPQGVCESNELRARKKSTCREEHDGGAKRDQDKKHNCDKDRGNKGNGGKNK